jgi:hypothetical protein
LIALLLGGPASARAMQEFLAYAPARVLSFNPLSVHPTPYLRMLILAEMLRRMGFSEDGSHVARIWRELYARDLPGRIPAILLETAGRLIPDVVDEVAFQPRRGLAQHALADIIPFDKTDERRIVVASRSIARGVVPADLPARFAVSASRHAFEARLNEPRALARTVIRDLSKRPGSETWALSAAA